MILDPDEPAHTCEIPAHPRWREKKAPAGLSQDPMNPPMIKVPLPPSAGLLFRCDECRTWWVSYVDRYVGAGYRPDGWGWRKVRMSWWRDRDLQRRIRRAEAEEARRTVESWQPGAHWLESPNATAHDGPFEPVGDVVDGPPPLPPHGPGGVHVRNRRG